MNRNRNTPPEGGSQAQDPMRRKMLASIATLALASASFGALAAEVASEPAPNLAQTELNDPLAVVCNAYLDGIKAFDRIYYGEDLSDEDADALSAELVDPHWNVLAKDPPKAVSLAGIAAALAVLRRELEQGSYHPQMNRNLIDAALAFLVSERVA